MLAGIVEELDALLRLTFQANSGKRAPWKPVRVLPPRPEGAPTAKREASPDELMQILGGGVTNGR